VHGLKKVKEIKEKYLSGEMESQRGMQYFPKMKKC
jgi:hypothetical protein